MRGQRILWLTGCSSTWREQLGVRLMSVRHMIPTPTIPIPLLPHLPRYSSISNSNQLLFTVHTHDLSGEPPTDSTSGVEIYSCKNMIGAALSRERVTNSTNMAGRTKHSANCDIDGPYADPACPSFVLVLTCLPSFRFMMCS